MVERLESLLSTSGAVSVRNRKGDEAQRDPQRQRAQGWELELDGECRCVCTLYLLSSDGDRGDVGEIELAAGLQEAADRGQTSRDGLTKVWTGKGTVNA